MELPEEMGYTTAERVCQKCIPVIKGAKRAAGTHEKPRQGAAKGTSDKGFVFPVCVKVYGLVLNTLITVSMIWLC